jgi:FecR protein
VPPMQIAGAKLHNRIGRQFIKVTGKSWATRGVAMPIFRQSIARFPFGRFLSSAPHDVLRSSIFASILILAAPALYAQNERVVRLGTVEGNAQVQHAAAPAVGNAPAAPQPGWEPALANMPLVQGDTLGTGDGVAEIEFENGATGYLGDNSALQFTVLGAGDAGPITRLTLVQGTARFYANVDGGVFEVLSGGVTVTLRERGDFRVDFYSDGISVSVFKGGASVATPLALAAGGSQTTELTPGQMLSFHNANPQALDITPLPNQDQLDAWAEYTSAMIAAGAQQVLNSMTPASPFTYGYGMSDLYDSGSWYNIPGYGWAWRPFGVSSSWEPFSNGIWRLAPHHDRGYAWVSFETWGWLPYHFGNWIHAPQGWAWIPGTSKQWQPATVGWVRVGNQVGWVPRAPGDQPNKLPANIKYGVVTNPVADTTTVLRGPYRILREDEVKNARALAAAPNPLPAAPPGSSMSKVAPPLVMQAPSNRTAPFPASGRPMARSFDAGSRAIVYDPATHSFVNANPSGATPGSQPTISFGASNAPRQLSVMPRVGVPANRIPEHGIVQPPPLNPGANRAVIRSMPPVGMRNPGTPQPGSEPRGVSPPRFVPPPGQPTAHPMPQPGRPVPQAPNQAQPGARGSASGGHPIANDAPRR